MVSANLQEILLCSGERFFMELHALLRYQDGVLEERERVNEKLLKLYEYWLRVTYRRRQFMRCL